jgi:hypothetical protein
MNRVLQQLTVKSSKLKKCDKKPNEGLKALFSGNYYNCEEFSHLFPGRHIIIWI